MLHSCLHDQIRCQYAIQSRIYFHAACMHFSSTFLHCMLGIRPLHIVLRCVCLRHAAGGSYLIRHHLGTFSQAWHACMEFSQNGELSGWLCLSVPWSHIVTPPWCQGGGELCRCIVCQSISTSHWTTAAVCFMHVHAYPYGHARHIPFLLSCIYFYVSYWVILDQPAVEQGF